ELVRTAAAATEAPLALREQLAGLGSRPAQRRRRAGWLAGLAGGLAAVLLAVLIALPGGSPGGPTVSQAAELATRPPQAPAPATDSAHPQLLARAVEGIPFPDW